MFGSAHEACPYSGSMCDWIVLMLCFEVKTPSLIMVINCALVIALILAVIIIVIITGCI